MSDNILLKGERLKTPIYALAKYAFKTKIIECVKLLWRRNLGLPMKGQTTLTWEQQEYSQFIQLINLLRSNNKISAEQWRAYRKQWEDQPQDRKPLSEKLQLRDSE